MNPHYPVKNKGKKMVEKQNAPNEINRPEPSKTVGGKVEQGPNEGKTDTDPNDKKDPIGNIIEKSQPDKISSPTQAEADRVKDLVVDKEEKDEKGNFILSSSINEEALEKHKQKAGDISVPVNMTAELTGSAGNVNLTADGHLNSDKSVREDRDIKEVFDELNKITGPNPTPLRDGNESTKAQNGVTGAGLMAIDQNTTFMGEDLKKIADKKGSLSDEDRDKLKNMSEQLKTVGKF